MSPTQEGRLMTPTPHDRSTDALKERVAALERRVRELDGSGGGGPGRPGPAKRHGVAHLGLAGLLLALLVAPLAVAQGGGNSSPDATTAGNARGEAVQIQIRNRSRGETGLVTASDQYSLRLSNTQQNGGGGAVYGCRAPSSAPSANRACLYADNLRQGEAFLFRSRQGNKVGHFDLGNPSGPPFSTNATGLVVNLNADRLDSRDSTTFMTNQVRTVLATSGNIPTGSAAGQDASCQAGEKATGGGAAWVIPGTNVVTALDGADIHASRPNAAGVDAATGWEASGRNDTGATRQLQAWVTCVPQ